MQINFDAFKPFLEDAGKSERTVSGYLADMMLFSRWFEQTNGEVLSSINLTPTILQESVDGRLWFQSANGLTWMDPQKGQWCWFTTEVSNLVEDGQGNLWMIAGGKLYQHSQTP